MRLVVISDTHLNHPTDLPNGDILLHCGDMTNRGTLLEYQSFLRWFRSQNYKRKIVIAGNHDVFAARDRAVLDQEGFVYLQDEAFEINGVKLYGSPWTPKFSDWRFQLPRDGEIMEKKWQQVPSDVDILMTHGPPYGILDEVERDADDPHQGCKELRKRVLDIEPKFHFFGHIHESSGKISGVVGRGTTFANVAQSPMTFEV